jgi:polysaccharide deacetylase family protein (PEP-CTERM system associated)
MQIFHQSATQFREDVRRAKCYLEDLLGQPVVGYRAPDFSITRQTLWAVEILAELGFLYDSSIFPIQHARYGIPGWPLHPVRVKLESGRSIVELPIGTLSLAGRRWPVGGGGYHRLLPWPLIEWAILHNLRREQPFVAYCHPYEFDVKEFAELDLRIPLVTRLHQGLGRRGFRAKFERMLTSFDSMSAVRLALDYQSPDYRSAELQ